MIGIKFWKKIIQKNAEDECWQMSKRKMNRNCALFLWVKWERWLAQATQRANGTLDGSFEPRKQKFYILQYAKTFNNQMV